MPQAWTTRGSPGHDHRLPVPAPTLALVLSPYVSETTRSRGEQYFRNGRVSLVGGDRDRASAVVRGTRHYDVSLSVRESVVVAYCSCPRFADNFGACKHIWATILAVTAAGALMPPEHAWLDALGGGRRRPATDIPIEPWRAFLAHVAPSDLHGLSARSPLGDIVYLLDVGHNSTLGGLRLELMTRVRRKSGEWGKPRMLRMSRDDIALLPDPRDHEILERLCGAVHSDGHPGYSQLSDVPRTVTLSPILQRALMPMLSDTGRLLVRIDDVARVAGRSESRYSAVAWTPALASFTLRVTQQDDGYRVDGTIEHDRQPMPAAQVLFASSTIVVWQTLAGEVQVSPFDAGGALEWIDQLRRTGPVTIPATAAAALAEALAASDVTHVECPAELRVSQHTDPPKPAARFVVADSERRRWATTPPDRLDVQVTFRYGDQEVDASAAQRIVFDDQTQEAWKRDLPAERSALARLESLGVRRIADWARNAMRFDVAASAVPEIVRVLISEGWRVESEGLRYVRASTLGLEVRSGIDWFELRGAADFDAIHVGVPALLEAARRRDGLVALGDGTFGVLPDEWMQRMRRVASLGEVHGDHLRFGRSQAALLDAWLDTEPDVAVDGGVERVRAQLAEFDRIAEVAPPGGFEGILRGYQQEALGWFAFLRRFGFGGCLADEMGLGKTVMVLAALEARRVERAAEGHATRPSLIVVPRSLVFNWTREATRFAPLLRVLDVTGADRAARLEQIASHDVVITTYGTLRRDVTRLAAFAFDYVILDEAQAIKNRTSHTAAAARQLQGQHRLALTGTPVENHLGELWSLFAFLNPGMLGSLRALGRNGDSDQSPDEDLLGLIAKGVRPFVLRRTKEQVAAELPERTEQTLYCELDQAQRAAYDQLRDHYRTLLLNRVDADGISRARLQILEALLRLRQAACHPGLIDPGRAGDDSAKFDVLLPRLEELLEDGRKVLVFSQFTTLLGLLRPRLEALGMAYEYLDGRTRDRQARVERFQSPDGPRLFLISLKAGGVGLNLTAADHVFLLDPWWNPAVEAQAIDRAHRIGQTRPVFAVRLIARDTVEEKVLQLQASKRSLADAIVRADERLIRDLRREDLELLLG